MIKLKKEFTDRSKGIVIENLLTMYIFYYDAAIYPENKELFDLKLLSLLVDAYRLIENSFCTNGMTYKNCLKFATYINDFNNNEQIIAACKDYEIAATAIHGVTDNMIFTLLSSSDCILDAYPINEELIELTLKQ